MRQFHSSPLVVYSGPFGWLVLVPSRQLCCRQPCISDQKSTTYLHKALLEFRYSIYAQYRYKVGSHTKVVARTEVQGL